jgi:hypothetical protein
MRFTARSNQVQGILLVPQAKGIWVAFDDELTLIFNKPLIQMISSLPAANPTQF